MARSAKRLMVAALVVWVTGLAGAQLSSGAEFHSSSSHTILDGSQIGEDVFTFNAGTLKCKSISSTGTTSSATTSSISLSPTLSECTAFGFVSSPVHMNKCVFQYVIFFQQDYENIICPEGKVIEVTAFNCLLTIGSQSNLTTWTATIIGHTPTRLMKLALSIAGISYTQHSKSFPGCSSNETKPRTDGTHKGEVTVTGTNTTGEQVDLWYE
jgi:hypothetical protein